ncbi:hypothetical protein KC333_g105 [Hortaea werneckii]|nr:hypothetical protein KC333_g105 [Hortaea werneckii]
MIDIHPIIIDAYKLSETLFFLQRGSPTSALQATHTLLQTGTVARPIFTFTPPSLSNSHVLATTFDRNVSGVARDVGVLQRDAHVVAGGHEAFSAGLGGGFAGHAERVVVQDELDAESRSDSDLMGPVGWVGEKVRSISKPLRSSARGSLLRRSVGRRSKVRKTSGGKFCTAKRVAERSRKLRSFFTQVVSDAAEAVEDHEVDAQAALEGSCHRHIPGHSSQPVLVPCSITQVPRFRASVSTTHRYNVGTAIGRTVFVKGSHRTAPGQRI